MDRREKIDCRANGEVIFRAMRSLLLEDSKDDQSGAVPNTSRSRSLISTKNGIDSTRTSEPHLRLSRESYPACKAGI